MFTWIKTGISIVSGLFTGSSAITYVLVAIIGVGSIGGVYFQYTSMVDKIKSQSIVILDQRVNVKALQNKIDVMKITNDENLKAIDNLSIEYNKTIESLRVANELEKQKIKTVTVIKERIKYVSKEDNGIAAPVLVDTFDRLRTAQGTRSKDSNSTEDSN